MSTSRSVTVILSSLRRRLLFALGLCAFAPLGAQNDVVDSLRTRLKAEGKTTARVHLLIDLAMNLASDEMDTTCIAFFDQAQTLSEELGYKTGLAYAPMAEAMRHQLGGRHLQAIAAFKDCIARLDAEHVEMGMSSPLSLIRRTYNSAGMQQERFAFYCDALARYKRTGPAMNATVCEHGLGGYYLLNRQYGQAIEHYMKAREGLGREHPDDAANETMVIGWCYRNWGNPKRAAPFLHEALEAFEQQGNEEQVVTVISSLGDIALETGDTLQALAYYRDTRPHWKALGPYREGSCRARYALALLAIGALDSAKAQVDALNALNEANPVPLSSTRGNCEVDYCNYLYRKAIGQDTVADRYLEHALSEAVRLADLPLVLKYRKALSHRYLEKGDERDAAIQAQAYIRMSDSLQAVANTDAIAAYEGQVKERENALELQRQDARLRQQRIVSFSIAGGLLLLVALAFTVYKGKKRSDALLHNILPEEVAAELKAKGHADAKHFDQATILFTDFMGFTQASEKMTPQELVEELNTCFKAFDGIITAHGIEKIKTIGDAYMCAGGLPDPKTSSPLEVVRAALEMQAFMIDRKKSRDAQARPAFEMRIGIHTGPVVAGIVGVKKFAYDIWGDTVNTASRLESSGEVGQVNISESTYALVREHAGSLFHFTPRGKVQAKGKGEMEMYFVRWSAE